MPTAGGIGLKCPNCGAENTEAALYCGGRAVQLREFAPVERGEVMPERLSSELDRYLNGRYLKLSVIFALVLGAIQLVEIATGEASTADIVFGGVCIVGAIALMVILRRHKSRGGMDGVMRHISVGAPIPPEGIVASARAASLAGVAVLTGFALMGAGFLVMAVVFYDGSANPAWAIAAVMGVAILGTIVLGRKRGRADVLLSREGVHFHSPWANATISFKRSELSALEMNGRVLRVGLSNPPYGMFRQSRHLLLGDAGERERFSQAVTAYGLQGPGRG